MNKFTLIIITRGWKVNEACKRWGIRYATYNARCNNERMHSQLLDMCNGLPWAKFEYTPLDGITQNELKWKFK